MTCKWLSATRISRQGTKRSYRIIQCLLVNAVTNVLTSIVDGVVIGTNRTGDGSKTIRVRQDGGFHGVAEACSDLAETVATVKVARNHSPFAVKAIALMMVPCRTRLFAILMIQQRRSVDPVTDVQSSGMCKGKEVDDQEKYGQHRGCGDRLERVGSNARNEAVD